MGDVSFVTPRERHVSRNYYMEILFVYESVTPRERRVSRNCVRCISLHGGGKVTPRERRVSRNCARENKHQTMHRHASREACE